MVYYTKYMEKVLLVLLHAKMFPKQGQNSEVGRFCNKN